MLLKCYYKFICIAGFLQLCYCQRRLVSGIDSIIGKKYMVYFVQSPFTRNFQNSWVCGGALVSPTQILTAAACLIEAENIYAIAGYKKYLKAESIENDECTRRKKQRVVKILIPTGYKLDYENPAQQMNIDIGVAIVEHPYNFSDISYLPYCSYEPQPIEVNFENKHELVNTRAVALGWGVRGKTQPDFTRNTKYQLLQETSTLIVDKKKCTNINDTQEIVQIINKYHLCGTINFQEVSEDIVLETTSINVYTMARHQFDSGNNNGDFKDFFGYRRSNYNPSGEEQIETIRLDDGADIQMNMTNNNDYGTRKSLHLNNCQNNLGGPLIKWIHDREVIIGITSSTNINGECNGPFLYVSTAASSKIIKCLLETNPFTRKLCNKKINDEPYEIQEIDIKWPDYQQSKILEPMLLVQRAVLDKIQPLIPRATIDYMKRSTHSISTKNYNIHQRHIHPKKHEALHDHVYQPHGKEYAHQRAQLPPLLSRPQYDIDVRYLKEQKYEPLSEELPSTKYYKELSRPQSPRLLSRPQYDIDARYRKEQQQESSSKEVPSTKYNKELLRPQFNLQSEKQYQPIPSYARESKPDQRLKYTIPDSQKYQSPSYHNHQYNSQVQQQNNERLQESYHYLPLREQNKPKPVQLYDSFSREEYNPLKEQKQFNNKQFEPPPLEIQYKPPIRQQHELPTSQEHTSVLEQYNAFLGHRLPNKQSEPQVTRQMYSQHTPYHYPQHETMAKKPTKEQFHQPELLYDLSREDPYEILDLTLNQPTKSVQSRMSIIKRPNEFANTQPNLYQQAHIGLIEEPFQKQLLLDNATTPSDDHFFSFDEIFAQLQDPPSESKPQIIRSSHEEKPKQTFFNRMIQESTPDVYEENNQHYRIYKSHTEPPESRDEVMIRPQIPLNKQYDEK